MQDCCGASANKSGLLPESVSTRVLIPWYCNKDDLTDPPPSTADSYTYVVRRVGVVRVQHADRGEGQLIIQLTEGPVMSAHVLCCAVLCRD
jgi:hypothetical protein